LFERPYNFHALRHTAITNVYRATKDLFLTQRFARHANPITTVAYTHPSDEELYAAIRGIEAYSGRRSHAVEELCKAIRPMRS